MKKSLKEIMMRDHSLIHNLLQNFIKKINSSPKESKKLFYKFKWTLEKHFFVEEKLIFKVFSDSQPDNEDMFELLKEHKDILWLISKIEEDLEENNKPKTTRLTEILSAHANFENNFFYPKLDENLNEDEKRLIINRLTEVVL